MKVQVLQHDLNLYVDSHAFLISLGDLQQINREIRKLINLL